MTKVASTEFDSTKLIAKIIVKSNQGDVRFLYSVGAENSYFVSIDKIDHIDFKNKNIFFIDQEITSELADYSIVQTTTGYVTDIVNKSASHDQFIMEDVLAGADLTEQSVGYNADITKATTWTSQYYLEGDIVYRNEKFWIVLEPSLLEPYPSEYYEEVKVAKISGNSDILSQTGVIRNALQIYRDFPIKQINTTENNDELEYVLETTKELLFKNFSMKCILEFEFGEPSPEIKLMRMLSIA